MEMTEHDDDGERVALPLKHSSCLSAVNAVGTGSRAYHGPVCEECMEAIRVAFARFLDACRDVSESATSSEVTETVSDTFDG